MFERRSLNHLNSRSIKRTTARVEDTDPHTHTHTHGGADFTLDPEDAIDPTCRVAMEYGDILHERSTGDRGCRWVWLIWKTPTIHIKNTCVLYHTDIHVEHVCRRKTKRPSLARLFTLLTFFSSKTTMAY